MVGTLYVVGAPAGDLDDLTHRALRILGEVALVVADDVGHARQLLTHWDIATPLVSAGGDAPLDALETADVALLSAGWSPGPSGPGYRLVCAALERGVAVVPIPGPTVPITALVVSGLPADSFVYLGGLPRQSSACRDLLASVADERRTLVVVEARDHISAALTDLHRVLGDRPLVVAAASEEGTEVLWRGSLGKVPGLLAARAEPGPYALVIGGASGKRIRWGEDRLRAEVETRLAQGLGAKEIGQQLAVESGWLRREIYRLAVEVAQSDAGEGREAHAEAEQR